MHVFFAFVIVFITLFIVPVIVYGLFSKYFGLKEPELKSRFFTGVVIQKVATTFGFVALFILAKNQIRDDWLIYGLIWFVMFAVTEIGQTFLSDYSKKEAVAGIVSEAIYFPVAAYVISRIV